MQEFKCTDCEFRAMRHADVELHRRTMHRTSSSGQTATFVVSAGGVQRLASAVASGAGNSKPDLLSLDSPPSSSHKSGGGGNRGQGKQRKYLCVMCDASFLQKAHLVSTVYIRTCCVIVKRCPFEEGTL